MSAARPDRIASTSHQRKLHQLLTAAGYEWVRTTGNQHNLYRHPGHGGTLQVPGTPKNQGHSERFIKAEIKRQATVEAQPVSAQTEPSPVDQIILLAERSVVKQPKNRLEQQARQTAIRVWLKRSLETLGPQRATDIDEAAKRLNVPASAITAARSALDCAAVRVGGGGAVNGKPGSVKGTGLWYVHLPHQVPEGAKPRSNPGLTVVGVDPVEAEHQIGDNNGEGPDPREEPPITPPEKDSENRDAETLPPPPPDAEIPFQPQPTEQQAAMLLLMESMGLKPEDPAKARRIVEAHERVLVARDALDQALIALGKAVSG